MRAWRSTGRSICAFKHQQARGFHCSRASQDQLRVEDLLRQQQDSTNVSLNGWVRSVRKQKKVAFAAIGDGSSVDSVQAVLRPEDAAGLSHGSAVQLTGDWRVSQGAKQSHELQVSRLEVLGENDAEGNPLQPKYQTAEFLRTIPHLRPRIPSSAVLLRLRSQLVASLTKYFNEEGFVQAHTPIITSSDCEGAGEVFPIGVIPEGQEPQQVSTEVDTISQHFFRSPKYLTVSAQLHLEALAQAVDKVWTLSSTFRAEKSDTARHLSEFYMLEAEICFTRGLGDVMDLVENMLRFAVVELSKSAVYSELQKVRDIKHPDEQDKEDAISAETLRQRWQGIVAADWPRISYTEAIDLLEQAHTANKDLFVFAPTYTEGLQAEHERYIATEVGNGKPVFVTHYPREQKPFYMLPASGSENSPYLDTVECFDLLVPDLCELVGGSLREHRSEELMQAMRTKGVAGTNLEWYLDLRKYGSVPHGGFGLGFDRLLCYLAGVGNVRDVVHFPRWYGRCAC